MKSYVMALDLEDDEERILEYEQWHRNVWPEIKKSILDAGITRMDIYRFSNRLCMIMEADADFSFAEKNAADAADPRVREWETLMATYQKAIPGAKPGEKWVVMNKIFELRPNE